jgi:hypothetical protein
MSRTLEILSSSGQVFRFFFDPAPAPENYEPASHTVALDSIRSIGLDSKGKLILMITNNPQRYRVQAIENTLYIYENMAARQNNMIPGTTSIPLPLTDSITTIRYIQITPNLKAMDTLDFEDFSAPRPQRQQRQQESNSADSSSF